MSSRNHALKCDISGSHVGEYEDDNFWDTVPCNPVEIALMMEALRTSETSVYFNEALYPRSYHLLALQS
jgi:hypothetical protein